MVGSPKRAYFLEFTGGAIAALFLANCITSPVVGIRPLAFLSKITLKVFLTNVSLCEAMTTRTVVSSETAPPKGFSRSNSPAVTFVGSSCGPKEQVAVINKGNLLALDNALISVLVNTRSCVHPSSPPCPR